jgi:hypothetical protein
MAKAKGGANTSTRVIRTKRKRPGVHSKKKSSRNKNSKLYKKKYRGQGKK